MGSENLGIRLTMAGEYIRRLTGDENTPVTFQAIDDTPKDDKHKRGNPIYNGTLKNLFKILCQKNDEGYGVFCTVNETDLKGRKTENMIGVRAILADDDDGINSVDSFPLRPHMAVRSSRKNGVEKKHFYFCTSGGDSALNQYDGVIERVVIDYKTCAGAKGLNRVLRLPGFYHRKDPGDPQLVEIIHMTDDAPYSWGEILKAFPPIGNGHGTTRAKKIKEAFCNDPVLLNLRAGGYVKKECPDGKIHIVCPFEEQHDQSSSESSTTYFVAHTNGYAKGHFKCFHEHCDKRTDEDFLKAIRATWEPGEEQGTNDDPLSELMECCVSQEYTEMLGEEFWLFPNLVIKNHIVTIIAKSNGGKTTIFFNYICPWILKNHSGVEILYLDCDSPASDHKRMKAIEKSIGKGFIWINPVTHGKDAKILIEKLEKINKAQRRLDNKIFIMDTLKKFLNLMDKQSAKPFFALLRGLVSLGATIVLLGHANKYRDNAGHLVFEGVGDVQNDSDEMIFFERIKAPDGMDVTTIVDPDKGAKVRGLFEPISFHIALPGRGVTQNQDIVKIPDWSGGAKKYKLTDEEIEDKIRTYLEGQTDYIKQSEIVQALKGVVPYHPLLNVLTACAIPEAKATMPGQIIFATGYRNIKSYSVVRN